MKIFQVVNVRWFNACAWYGLYLARLLQQDGHDVLVIVQPDTPPEKKARELGLETYALDMNSANPLRFVPAAAKAANLVRCLRPEIVNCHRGEGFFFWALLKALGAGFRLIRTRGDQRLPKSDPVNRWLHASVADSVVVTNRSMARYFRERMATPADRLWLVQGGVDTDTFKYDAAGRKAVREELGYAPDDFVIGILGRFDLVKGQKELIDILARILPDLPQCKLMLAGFSSATQEHEVRQWVAEKGLEDHVAITGKRSDVSSVISAMDLGVVASLWSEAIARSALEIMACRRPLVSTSVGVMPDLLEPEALVPPADLTGLEALIRKAVESEPFRAQLVSAQAKVISQLSGRDFLRRTLSIYQTALDKKQSAS